MWPPLKNPYSSEDHLSSHARALRVPRYNLLRIKRPGHSARGKGVTWPTQDTFLLSIVTLTSDPTEHPAIHGAAVSI